MFMNLHGVSVELKSDTADDAEWVELFIREWDERAHGIALFSKSRVILLRHLRDIVNAELRRIEDVTGTSEGK